VTVDKNLSVSLHPLVQKTVIDTDHGHNLLGLEGCPDWWNLRLVVKQLHLRHTVRPFPKTFHLLRMRYYHPLQSGFVSDCHLFTKEFVGDKHFSDDEEVKKTVEKWSEEGWSVSFPTLAYKS